MPQAMFENLLTLIMKINLKLNLDALDTHPVPTLNVVLN